MVNIVRKQPEPPCLSIEKKKANGDYKCGEALERLHLDFHNKCYICEEKSPSTINVEHFVPHKGDKQLKFSWVNLFLSCGHCNNVKLGKYDNILNCTDSSVKIVELLRFKCEVFPMSPAVITAVDDNIDEKVLQTAKLLDEVYNGTTVLKKLEADNIRDKLIREIISFNDKLHEYYEPGITEADKQKLKNKIARKLSVESPFTAFKVWIIKDNTSLYRDFKDLLP